MTMPRQARFVLPGHLHHVTQRGNYRRNIFFEDQDKAVYLKYINEYAEQYGTQIYAYSLMDNHVHFIVRPHTVDSLARTFKVTHQKYSLYLNKRLKEYGHRWQARFYSCVVLGSHIPKAIRYVEQNPVRAGMVDVPWKYAWSSARAHLGKEYRIITLADITEYVKVDSWKEFLMSQDDPEELKLLRVSTDQGKVFAVDEEVRALEERFRRRFEVVRIRKKEGG